MVLEDLLQLPFFLKMNNHNFKCYQFHLFIYHVDCRLEKKNYMYPESA